MVDWLDFKLNGINLVSDDIFALSSPIKTIDYFVGFLNRTIYSNANYYELQNARLVVYFQLLYVEWNLDKGVGLINHLLFKGFRC